MFGKTSYLSPLQARKELLIAESELNRAQLSAEWQTMAHGVGGLAHRVRTIGAWASSAALLVAGLAAFRRTRVTAAQDKPSWWQTLLKGAQLAASLWTQFHRRAG